MIDLATGTQDIINLGHSISDHPSKPPGEQQADESLLNDSLLSTLDQNNMNQFNILFFKAKVKTSSGCKHKVSFGARL